MKVCQINNLDISGGAARAAFRLHKELQQNSIDSTMLVQHKESDDNTVIGPQTNIAKAMANLRTPLDHLPKLIYPNRKQTFYHFQWLPDLLSNTIKNINPDIVHLHWICRGFVNINTLARINKPIVWTLHDMWAFTGGCHYTGSCEGYQKQCGRCPQLGSNHRYDLSWWSWKRKARCWSKLNLKIVAPSKWMKHCIQKSSLLKNAHVEVIPNGLDLKRYKPMN